MSSRQQFRPIRRDVQRSIVIKVSSIIYTVCAQGLKCFQSFKAVKLPSVSIITKKKIKPHSLPSFVSYNQWNEIYRKKLIYADKMHRDPKKFTSVKHQCVNPTINVSFNS